MDMLMVVVVFALFCLTLVALVSVVYGLRKAVESAVDGLRDVLSSLLPREK
jgi:hypothetical protein